MLVRVLKVNSNGVNTDEDIIGQVFEVFETSLYPDHYLLIQSRGNKQLLNIPGIFGSLFEGPIPMLLKSDVERVIRWN